MERVQNNEIYHEEMVTELRKFGAESLLVEAVTFYCTVKIVNCMSVWT